MTSADDNGNIICAENYSSPAIQFTNVSDNEKFAFSLIIVKGYVVRCDTKSNSQENLVVSRLKKNEPVKEFSYHLRSDKFSVLLPLEAGKNEFSFCISQYTVIRTYYYESRTRSRIVTPIYIVCRDEDECPEDDLEVNVCAKIVIGCRLIQTLLAESLFLSGCGRKTFFLEEADSNDNNQCVVFRSRLHVNVASEMSAEELWEYFGRELMTSEYGTTKRKFVAFASLKKGKSTKQLAIGGGGLALCDVQFVETWPSTLDGIRACFGYYNVDTDLKRWQQHFAKFSSSLGAVCHELCHTFDLGHTLSGIMGRDFNRVSSLFVTSDKPAAPVVTMTNMNVNRNVDNKNSLMVSEGMTRRFLNIKYSVNNNIIEEAAENLFEFGKKNLGNILSEQNFWSNGCAVLLSHHRWIKTVSDLPANNQQNMNNVKNIIRYDHIRGIITSTYSIVVVQLRRQCGFVLKSWEFSMKRNKTLFLVPLYEARRASVIVVEDIEGNLLKQDLETLF